MPFPAEIARLHEGRQARFLAALARHSTPFAGGFACYEGPDSRANSTFGAGLSGAVGDAELDAWIAFFTQFAEPARIELCPLAHPTLFGGLRARSFVVGGFETVLARSLGPDDDLRGMHPHGWPGAGFHWVDPYSDLDTDPFLEAATAGFRDPGQAVWPDLARSTRRVMRHPTVHSVVAEIDGKAVGGAMVEVADEACFLMNGSVVPEARGRGLHQALILLMLERARDLGARLAVAECAPGSTSERNTLRLGFQVAYTRVQLEQPPHDNPPPFRDS